MQEEDGIRTTRNRDADATAARQHGKAFDGFRDLVGKAQVISSYARGSYVFLSGFRRGCRCGRQEIILVKRSVLFGFIAAARLFRQSCATRRQAAPIFRVG
jgi:hypothetical protein